MQGPSIAVHITIKSKSKLFLLYTIVICRKCQNVKCQTVNTYYSQIPVMGGPDPC